VLSVGGLEITYPLPRRRIVRAVRDVSFDVAAGEIFGLVGESGSGKSSIAKAIVGLQRPTAGRIALNGTDIWSLPHKQWRQQISPQVGVVFQDPTSSLNPRKSVTEILQDPLRIHGNNSRETRQKRATELVDLVRLPSRILRQLPRELSGGQRQRVAIARSLALRPAVLVADEPTSSLDVSIRNQILNLLLDLRDELQVAMIVISHDMAALIYLADSVGVMYLGRLVETGTVDDVHDRFRHPYTAALLASRPTLGSPSTAAPLAGGPASAIDVDGCPFEPRCWRATPECRTAYPAAETSGRHAVHCLHPLSSPSAPSPDGAASPTGASSKQQENR
jgi:peptide/nickel transport system ATP-binding protein